MLKQHLETQSAIHLKPLACKGIQSKGGHGPKPLFTQTGASSSIHITEQETHITNSFISNNGSIHKQAREKLYYLLNNAFIVKILIRLCLAQLILITPSVCTVCILSSCITPQALLHLTGITPTKISPESPLPQENNFL